MAQNASRIYSSQTLTVGSTTPATTAVVSQSVFTLRLASSTPVRAVVADAALTTSAQVLQQGFLLSADRPEYVATNPGQIVSVIAPTTSNAAVSISEVG